MNYLVSVFFSPSEAYRQIKEREIILLPIILILLVLGGTSLLLHPISARDNAQLVSQNPRLSEMLTEEQIESIRNPSTSRMVIGSVMHPVSSIVGCLIYALLLMIIANAAGCDLSYKKVFSAILLSSLISPVLSTLFKTPVIMAKGTALGVSTSLSLLSPDSPFTSITFQILEVFDLFSIWALVVLIAGISVLAGIGKQKAAGIVVTAWIIKNAGLILFSMISLKLSGVS
ncbi:MAG: YIP1 family protein [Candidatus Glassbacteria bacterium]